MEVESQNCREKESIWAWRRQEDTGVGVGKRIKEP